MDTIEQSQLESIHIAMVLDYLQAKSSRYETAREDVVENTALALQKLSTARRTKKARMTLNSILFILDRVIPADHPRKSELDRMLATVHQRFQRR